MKLVASLGLTAMLAACGGGGDGGGTPNAVAEGVWSGTTSTGYSLNLLVLEDNSFYSIFGTVAGGVFGVVGFDQGAGSISGNSFTGSGREYLSNNTSSAGTVNATVTTSTSINGTATSGAGSSTFATTPISNASYVYSNPAAIGDVSGTWTGTMLDGSAATVSISGGGAVTGSNAGCSFTGTATPRPSGKNVFNVSVTFGAAPCGLPGQTATGIAINYLLAGGARQLIVAVQDATKANGAMFLAQR